jgi:maleylpyruvate isomerase
MGDDERIDRTRDLDRAVEGCAGAHQRLLSDLVDADDEVMRRPSLLPGWTVGHLLTHLARNADSHRRMFEAADRGEIADQYDGGQEGRGRDIDAGADRSAREIVADVRRSIYALEGAWATTSATGWDGAGRTVSGETSMPELVFRRWREAEVHRSDLGLGVSPDDWSPEYVRFDLERWTMTWASRRPMGLTTLPAEVLALTPARRLAWLMGRFEVPGLPAAGLW